MTGELGRFGEVWARGYLARNGYRILETNVRYRTGEIDIVAEDETGLVFVEVKCRRSSGYGSAVEAVSAAKYARLARAVETYVQQHHERATEYRLDVIALEVDRRGNISEVTHLRGVEPPS
jgi:putative endonuclease